MVAKFVLLTSIITLAFPDILYGITTIHHDKPVESRISEMATQMSETVNRQVPSNVFPERQKRLLPYVNYYLSNQRKPTRENFTPFLESNALPGPFVPIVPHKNPSYVEIFETLSQLKQSQDAMRHNLNQIFTKPVNYVPVYYDVPSKTTIETFTPTNIDIDVQEKKYNSPELYRQKPQIIDYVIEKSVGNYRPQTFSPQKPVVLFEGKAEKPIVFTPKPAVNTIVEEKYVAQKIIPIEHQQYVTEKPTYIEYFSTPAPQVNTENTNILTKILKQLQNQNTLPQTFTPHNIDNSIKTLVKILNGLGKQEGLKEKPIVVVEDEAVATPQPLVEKHSYNPTSFQVFPANTIDGGTPGRPGIDYPALSSIPQTDFNCKTQRYKGFFGDPHTNCQVWHYCDLNGGQASFLCPNGTIFSQVALTCDWWYNVKCSSTAQLYVLNERLYKYILPLAPKFPEDYSGPLVDRYLALKFQEMEEKMKNEKKDEKSEVEEKDDSDQLQDIQNERAKASEES